MRLGELIATEKLVAKGGLEEALEHQVTQGGRLGTNLVELGLINEKELARLLGKQHNCAYASGEMTPAVQAMELLDPDFCDDKDLLPMRVDQTRITCAVINPNDMATLDAVGFKTGKRVVPVVIPEFRMNQLLRRYCKAFRVVRPLDMGKTVPSRTLGTKKDGPNTDVGGEDLINDAEFQKLYDSAISGGAPAEEELPEAAIVEEPAAKPAAPAPAAAAAAAAAAPPPEQVAQVEQLPTPLKFAEAQAMLQKSNDREDVAKTVLRFAIGKWRRALLLSVQGDFITGWHGLGKGIRESAVQRIGIPLRGPNTFKLVRDTKSHYIGPMKQDVPTAGFYKRLGGGYPKTAVLLPLLVRSKLVHVLYVDNGPDKLTPPDIGELLILSQGVARSYEAMIARRQKG
jgi:hypothetical protein